MVFYIFQRLMTLVPLKAFGQTTFGVGVSASIGTYHHVMSLEINFNEI